MAAPPADTLSLRLPHRLQLLPTLVSTTNLCVGVPSIVQIVHAAVCVRLDSLLVDYIQTVSLMSIHRFNVMFIVTTAATFIHIPRTGGIAQIIHRAAPSHVWHSAHRPPPSCGHVLLRNETQRYCSEWKFYGIRFLVKNESVKGWRLRRPPTSFADFLADNSTHNSQVKILAGCNMYDYTCVINRSTVDTIIQKIHSGCITVMKNQHVRAHVHNKFCTTTELALAYSVNGLDRLLLRRINAMGI